MPNFGPAVCVPHLINEVECITADVSRRGTWMSKGVSVTLAPSMIPDRALHLAIQLTFKNRQQLGYYIRFI